MALVPSHRAWAHQTLPPVLSSHMAQHRNTTSRAGSSQSPPQPWEPNQPQTMSHFPPLWLLSGKSLKMQGLQQAGGERGNSTRVSFRARGNVWKKSEGSAESDFSKVRHGGDAGHRAGAGRTDRSVTLDFLNPLVKIIAFERDGLWKKTLNPAQCHTLGLHFHSAPELLLLL